MSDIANDIVKKMAYKNKKKAEEIKSYFVDMEEVFVESFRILKNGGMCCFVIGNTKILGVDILNAEVEEYRRKLYRREEMRKRVGL